MFHDDGVESYQLFLRLRVGEKQRTWTRWYDEKWITDEEYVPEKRANLSELRETVVKAVKDRLMSDVPYAVLLSGGLDSSLITSIAVRNRASATNTYGSTEKVHSFSIGIKGAPDLKAARKVAIVWGPFTTKFISRQRKRWTRYRMWFGTWSVRTSAASYRCVTLQRLNPWDSKWSYPAKAPTNYSAGTYTFTRRRRRRTSQGVRENESVHQWDVARANKMTMAWGVERGRLCYPKQSSITR